MKNKKPYTTRPNVISFLYFLTIYLSIIIIGKFNKKKLILDFGSGLGYLKKINLKLRNPSKIVNYDKIAHLSEVKKWDRVKFNTVVFCQSAYMLSKKDLNAILQKIYKINLRVEIIVAFSTKSKANIFISKILGHKDAYTGLKLNPAEEESIFLKKCKVIKRFNFCNLYKIYLLKF